MIVKMLLATLESDIPDLIAMALTTVVLDTEKGLLYVAELESGVLPSVVYFIVAPGVADVRVTFCTRIDYGSLKSNSHRVDMSPSNAADAVFPP